MKKVLLVGNGSYTNRGCEAIFRGTKEILDKELHNPEYTVISYFNSDEDFNIQKKKDKDLELVKHYKVNRFKSRDLTWAYYNFKELLSKLSKTKYFHEPISSNIDSFDAVLSIGGDNYSLDYGIPKLFTDFDEYSLSHGKPTFIWGASIGPFSANPDYEKVIAEKLKKITGIFCRESESVKYLKSIGVKDNVYYVADPAFCMVPKVVEDIDSIVKSSSIGLNFSPLMAKYITNGDMEKWQELCVNIVKGVLDKTKADVILIPHVISSHSSDNEFLRKIHNEINSDKLSLLGDNYSAAELKYIISKLKIFAGSRTHATIAALSSEIPTISFSYSMKAKGINKDIFGKLYNDFCIEPQDMNAEYAINKISMLYSSDKQAKDILASTISEIKERSYSAAKILKSLI